MVNANLQQEILQEMVTNEGESLASISNTKPVLLVFLRHFGCVFCREALVDIAARSKTIEENGTKIVFVHMASNEIAERYFSRYELENATHISDPECKYYQIFGLTKGTFTQLFGLQTWIRGFSAGVVKGYGVGPQLGDGFQMPGVFVIQDSKVMDSFIHKLASDRPDYNKLVNCCALPSESN